MRKYILKHTQMINTFYTKISGGSRISTRWGHQLSRGGINIHFCKNFQITAWNWKNLDPGGCTSKILLCRSATENNIAQLYYILGRAELHWNFSSWLRDASDIHRFPALHMVKTNLLLENLWISKPSLSILEKFQCSLALPNIKYNFAILFLCEM